MSHLVPEQLTSTPQNSNNFSEDISSSDWTEIQSKNSQKKQKNVRKRPQTPPSIKNTSYLEGRKQKTAQKTKKLQKNSENYSLSQQTTRDSIYAVYTYSGNSDITKSTQNRNKQSGTLQLPIFSLLYANSSDTGILANAELPNQATTQQTNFQK